MDLRYSCEKLTPDLYESKRCTQLWSASLSATKQQQSPDRR